MSKVKIELNSRAIRDLLKSNEVRDCIKEKADEISALCGDGYESDIYYTSSRVVSSVYTATSEAYKDNLDNNTLLKASKV